MCFIPGRAGAQINSAEDLDRLGLCNRVPRRSVLLSLEQVPWLYTHAFVCTTYTIGPEW